MAEFTGGNENIISVGEPIVFENKTESNYEVCAGIVFHNSGIYEVLVDGNRTIVSKVSERKTGKYHDPFGNPIYVYVRVGDKTVAIKADDLQKALDSVTENGEEVTIKGRREAVNTAISALQEQDVPDTNVRNINNKKLSETQKELDTISRQDAIDAIDKALSRTFVEPCGEMILKDVPSAQPYTEAEIQNMQDLYQAEIDEAFELGREDARSDIIYCGECKHVGTDAICCLVCCREGMGLRPYHVYQDDYCSYAERKEEKEESGEVDE